MMRPAFTLLELIFSMVIVAIVFTVVPKLMFATTKTMEVAIKEDGLFAALSLMGDIVRLPWDLNTVSSNGKILDTDVNTCNQYRVGGFIGSRNCLDSSASATQKVNFATIGTFDSVGDYDGYTSTLSGDRIDYTLSAEVNYVDENFDSVLGSEEIKEVNVSVSASGKTKLCASFFYYSANLGHVQINKRAW